MISRATKMTKTLFVDDTRARLKLNRLALENVNPTQTYMLQSCRESHGHHIEEMELPLSNTISLPTDTLDEPSTPTASATPSG
jgi:hypothetical protein